MLKRISIFILLITTIELKAIKILLVAPKFGRSHVTFIGHVADELVEAGFDVVCFCILL